MTELKETVRERYASHARNLDDAEDGTPPTLGLGDPVSLAQLREGETVLDLGSGPGRDLLAAARAVGRTGRAIGVDMTQEMIERARAAASAAGLENVSILDGDLERLPVHCGAVDVVISNCVINLVPDKKRALIEAYRALRPGGRLAILDTAFETEPPAEIRNDPAAWCGCVGGSLVRDDYEALLKDIGYENVELRWLDESCGDACAVGEVKAGSLAVTATKPGSSDATLRPAVPSDKEQIEALLGGTVRTEDAIVALDGGSVVGAVVLERWGATSVIRALAGPAPVDRQVLIAAIEVARWSGAEEVRAAPRDLYTAFGFVASGEQVKLNFEESNLPLISKPSLKPLPTFKDGACC
jgi:SAM-dependent methyltransferase